MKILLIVFVILFIIIKIWTAHIKNDVEASFKFIINGGSYLLGILVLSEYVIGGIIFIKIILKIMG